MDVLLSLMGASCFVPSGGNHVSSVSCAAFSRSMSHSVNDSTFDQCVCPHPSPPPPPNPPTQPNPADPGDTSLPDVFKQALS